MENAMKRHCEIGILLTALAIGGSAQPSPQNSAPGPWQNFLIPDGETVYDNVNHVTWLADGNLAAMSVPGTLNFRFGLPLCPPLTIEPTESCVNENGSMNYTSALAWVQGMNDANYLGHHDWQLPTSPKRDHSCREKGPYNNFGFDCKKNALSYLYYEELGFTATETAVPIPPNTVGPFSNFQPNFYWSDSTSGNVPDFSFGNGVQSGSTRADFLDVLPMI